MTDYKRQVIRATLIMSIFLVLSNLFQYLIRFTLARNLTSSQYGLVYSAVALLGLVSIFQHLGMTEALIKYVSEFKSRKLIRKIKDTIYTVFLFQQTSAILLCIVGFILADFLSANYFRIHESKTILYLLSFFIILTPFDLVLGSTLIGYKRNDLYAIQSFLKYLGLLIFTYIFIKLQFSIYSLFIAYIISYFFIPPIFLAIIYNKVFYQLKKIKSRLNNKLTRKIIKFSSAVMITSTVGLLINYTDTIMLTIMTNLSQVGLYNTAAPLSRIFLILSEITVIIILPLSSELWIIKKEYLSQGVKILYKYVALLTIPIVILIISFPELIISTLFGYKYIEASNALRILLIGSFFLTFANINTSIISGIGKPRINMAIVIIGAIINIIGNLILIPRLNIVGASISTSLAFIFIFLFSFYYIKNKLKINFLIKSMLKLFLLILILLASLFYINKFIIISFNINLILIILAFFTIYLIMILILNIIDLNEIKEIINNIRTRSIHK